MDSNRKDYLATTEQLRELLYINGTIWGDFIGGDGPRYFSGTEVRIKGYRFRASFGKFLGGHAIACFWHDCIVAIRHLESKRFRTLSMDCMQRPLIKGVPVWGNAYRFPLTERVVPNEKVITETTLAYQPPTGGAEDYD